MPSSHALPVWLYIVPVVTLLLGVVLGGGLHKIYTSRRKDSRHRSAGPQDPRPAGDVPLYVNVTAGGGPGAGGVLKEPAEQQETSQYEDLKMGDIQGPSLYEEFK